VHNRGGGKHGLGFFFFLPCDCKYFEGMMEEEEEHLAAAAAAGTCRAESESSPHHQEVREGIIGGHYYWSSEELLFQELVTQLLLSSSIKQQQQLQGNNDSPPPPPRLGSGELVQLRKLFQETTRTTRLFKLLDVQVQEVKDLEAEMRELKLQGTTTEGRGGEGGHTTTQTKAWNGSLMMMMRYSEDEEVEDTAVEDDVVVGGAKDLETKMMQLGDMELEQQHGDDTRLEEAAAAESQKQQQHNSGKRRTCFGVAISKFDVKKSRLDHLPSFTKPKPILKEEEAQ